MNKAKQVYVTYIRSTPEKVWDAITNPEMTRQYWGYNQASEWKPGAAWEHRRIGDPSVAHVAGKVIETAPPKRLVVTWANAADVNNPDKVSRVTFELENLEDVVCLTVTHSELEPDSDMLRGISRGWPLVLSSLKSLLETGKPIDILFLKSVRDAGGGEAGHGHAGVLQGAKEMSNSKFLYVTYIRTSAEKVWDALTNKELMKTYWFNMYQESSWTAGSPWEMKDSKGEVWDAGKILESHPPHKLVISWQHQHHEVARDEGFTRMTYLIETAGPMVKLTVSHESDVENSDLIAKVSGGWPMILSSLKSLLETGEALPRP